jgi:hypothetical protein
MAKNVSNHLETCPVAQHVSCCGVAQNVCSSEVFASFHSGKHFADHLSNRIGANWDSVEPLMAKEDVPVGSRRPPIAEILADGSTNSDRQRQLTSAPHFGSFDAYDRLAPINVIKAKAGNFTDAKAEIELA